MSTHETDPPSEPFETEYTRAIVETLREPLMVLDGELRVRFANRAFREAFGVATEEALETHVYELGAGQWDLPELRALLRDVIEDDRAVEDYRVEDEFEGLGTRVMLLNARRFRGSSEPDGERILLAIEDVTERERTREQLERHAVEVERSNRALEEFAYVSSHDLQEPLRKITAFGERLEGVAGDALGERARDYLDRMLDAASRMRTMIDDLLAYSRISRREPELEPVALAEVLEATLDDLEVALEKSDAEVEVGALPVVRGDRALLRLLLQNLISNAIKYRREDRPPEIRVDGEVDDGEARLRVRDRGIGFDESYLDRIFDPFQRLHGRETYEGSGIGLAICRRIAESHDGAISAESAPGEGATFIVTFPAATEEETA